MEIIPDSIAIGTINDIVIKGNCGINSLYHIVHNVILEENVTVIAGTFLYGSSHIGKNAYITSGIVWNQNIIDSNVLIAIGFVVIGDVLPDKIVMGMSTKEKWITYQDNNCKTL